MSDRMGLWGYTPTEGHVGSIWYGDWHTFAYCQKAGCDWTGPRSNQHYEHSRHYGKTHDEWARWHERKANRRDRWRRFIYRQFPAPTTETEEQK